jgi:putative transposase
MLQISIKELKNDVQGYMEFYNYYRFHQTLGYKRPMEVYNNKKYFDYIKQNYMANNIELLQKVT